MGVAPKDIGFTIPRCCWTAKGSRRRRGVIRKNIVGTGVVGCIHGAACHFLSQFVVQAASYQKSAACRNEVEHEGQVGVLSLTGVSAMSTDQYDREKPHDPQRRQGYGGHFHLMGAQVHGALPICDIKAFTR